MNPINKCGIWKSRDAGSKLPLSKAGRSGGAALAAHANAARGGHHDDAGRGKAEGQSPSAWAESAAEAEDAELDGEWRWSPQEGPATSGGYDQGGDAGSDSWLRQRH